MADAAEAQPEHPSGPQCPIGNRPPAVRRAARSLGGRRRYGRGPPREIGIPEPPHEILAHVRHEDRMGLPLRARELESLHDRRMRLGEKQGQGMAIVPHGHARRAPSIAGRRRHAGCPRRLRREDGGRARQRRASDDLAPYSTAVSDGRQTPGQAGAARTDVQRGRPRVPRIDRAGRPARTIRE